MYGKWKRIIMGKWYTIFWQDLKIVLASSYKWRNKNRKKIVIAVKISLLDQVTANHF